ncbi:MAG: RDD family protein, partial [Mariprofundaceae bacterium]
MAETARLKGVPAGIIKRFAAASYDLIILFSITFVIVGGSITLVKELIGPVPNWLQYMLFITVCYAYLVGFWVKDGSTTGMRPWKLKIVMADSGDPINLASATIRFLALMITWLALLVTFFYLSMRDTQSPLYVLAALIPALSLAMMFSRKRQTLHDFLAGTSVYRIGRGGGRRRAAGRGGAGRGGGGGGEGG